MPSGRVRWFDANKGYGFIQNEQGADVFLTGADVPGATRLPMVPDLHPLVAPLVTMAVFYAFIETLARRRGFDPDTPPHLRKVTETV